MLTAEKDDDDNDYRESFSLSKKKITRVFLPQAKDRECFSTMDGLLPSNIEVSEEWSYCILFSHAQIHLPPHIGLRYWEPTHETSDVSIDKIILSANPSLSSNYVV